MSSHTIQLKIQGSVGRICFGHPSKNAMTLEMLNRLASLIEQANESTLNALLIESLGDSVFCAGANFDELLALKDENQASEFFSGFARVILAIKHSKSLVIARVQGIAVGGGVGLLAACDYVLATKDAFIKLSEIGIGIAPLVIEPAVTRKIGVGAMAQFSLNPSDWKSAEWAEQHSLYQSVHSDISALDLAVEEKLDHLSKYSPKALAALKHSLWAQTEHFDALLYQRAKESGTLALSPSAQNILQAFKTRKNA